jgi:hypothetical protein
MERTRAREMSPMKVQKTRKNAWDLDRPITPLNLRGCGGGFEFHDGGRGGCMDVGGGVDELPGAREPRWSMTFSPQPFCTPYPHKNPASTPQPSTIPNHPQHLYTSTPNPRPSPTTPNPRPSPTTPNQPTTHPTNQPTKQHQTHVTVPPLLSATWYPSRVKYAITSPATSRGSLAPSLALGPGATNVRRTSWMGGVGRRIVGGELGRGSVFAWWVRGGGPKAQPNPVKGGGQKARPNPPIHDTIKYRHLA